MHARRDDGSMKHGLSNKSKMDKSALGAFGTMNEKRADLSLLSSQGILCAWWVAAALNRRVMWFGYQHSREMSKLQTNTGFFT